MSNPSSGAPSPKRGEVWEVDLSPVVGREQAGRRPALIVSVDAFNQSPRGLVVVLAVTGTVRGLPTHVPVAPPEGGLTKPSVIMTEQIRSISKDRLIRRYGVATKQTLEQTEQILRMLLGL